MQIQTQNKIKIGILGYGNLGRGVEYAIKQNPDMELVAVFTRHAPSEIKISTETAVVAHTDDIDKYKDCINVLILCIGSATDLPEYAPKYAKMFNTVDSFDTHPMIPEYFDNVNKAAADNGHISVIATGWDPGMFSLNRLYAESILPQGDTYTFWGKGVSQGHSNAIRNLSGVKNAVQYTVPIESAVEAARSGSNPELTTRQKHLRICYVVAEEGADKTEIENMICTMPKYFAEYDTEVNFITEEEFKLNHSAMPHGGFVIRSGQTGENNKHIVEYSIKLDSNPEFTSSILVAYARAAYRLSQSGEIGARTVFDIAPALLSIKSAEELRAELL